jgi:hypothetical protein
VAGLDEGQCYQSRVTDRAYSRVWKTIPPGTRGKRENMTYFFPHHFPIMPNSNGFLESRGVIFMASFRIFTPRFAITFLRPR